MDRRGFFKLIGGVFVAAVVPKMPTPQPEPERIWLKGDIIHGYNYPTIRSAVGNHEWDPPMVMFSGHYHKPWIDPFPEALTKIKKERR